MAPTSTCKQAAEKLLQNLRRLGIKLEGKVHVTKKARSKPSPSHSHDFSYAYENEAQGELIKFRSRKGVVDFLKERESKKNIQHNITYHVTPNEMLNEWMDQRIEKCITEKEAKRTNNQWNPSVKELSHTYKNIVMDSLERKSKIQKLMDE